MLQVTSCHMLSLWRHGLHSLKPISTIAFQSIMSIQFGAFSGTLVHKGTLSSSGGSILYMAVLVISIFSAYTHTSFHHIVTIPALIYFLRRFIPKYAL